MMPFAGLAYVSIGLMGVLAALMFEAETTTKRQIHEPRALVHPIVHLTNVGSGTSTRASRRSSSVCTTARFYGDAWKHPMSTTRRMQRTMQTSSSTSSLEPRPFPRSCSASPRTCPRPLVTCASASVAPRQNRIVTGPSTPLSRRKISRC